MKIKMKVSYHNFIAIDIPEIKRTTKLQLSGWLISKLSGFSSAV